MRSAVGSSTSRSPETVREALAAASARLAAAGCESPGLDAELLLAHALGSDREALFREARRELSGGERAAFEQLVARRAGREPVAYIVGRRAFRHIELAADARALIPRPETELLVEVGLGLPRSARVADVGTGSGAIALALKHERPDLSVVACDVSADALALAAGNAERLGLEVELVLSDLLAGVPGRLDAVLANLPYVAEGERAALAPEIADHEPAQALFAGPDGLSQVRRLIAQASGVELLALEIGAGQAGAVAELARAAGFGATELLPDLAGIDRVVVARRC